MADEEQAPAPGRSLELTAADDVGLDPELGPEREQRRIGDRELLVRGGREREPVVLREDRGARLKVEDQCACPRLGDMRHRERSRKLPR